jgi:hypothetical protein
MLILNAKHKLEKTTYTLHKTTELQLNKSEQELVFECGSAKGST